jgi:hypothetical protein
VAQYGAKTFDFCRNRLKQIKMDYLALALKKSCFFYQFSVKNDPIQTISLSKIVDKKDYFSKIDRTVDDDQPDAGHDDPEFAGSRLYDRC